jgi:hypothetical protein
LTDDGEPLPRCVQGGHLRLLDVVEPHAAGLAEARRRFGLDAGLHIFIDVYQMPGSPHVLLRADTMRRLAAALDLLL